MFVHSSPALQPDHDYEKIAERALNSYALGEHVAPQSTRDARFSGGIVYRYGGTIDFDSVAASVAGDRATVARWAPGDDSGVGEALETVWVR